MAALNAAANVRICGTREVTGRHVHADLPRIQPPRRLRRAHQQREIDQPISSTA
jgi:hypothetical protein